MINSLGRSFTAPPPAAVAKTSDESAFADWLVRKTSLPSTPEGSARHREGHGNDGHASVLGSPVQAPGLVQANRTLQRGLSTYAEQLQSGAHSTRNTVPVPAPQDAGAPPHPMRSEVLEFHFSSARGTVEILSVPWHLISTGLLSQIDVAAVALRQGASESTAPSRLGPANDAEADKLVFALSRGSSHQAPASVTATSPGRFELTSSDDFEETLPSSAALSEQLPEVGTWLQRMIRWTELQGHPATVWIRDYSLDENKTRQVENAIHAFAKEHAAHLERIVINAHEVWRRPRADVLETA